ncbi:alpha-amylase family glycosyl hydrolase [Jannaschia formosa]|uniref:alpha-amylase family glycosyl hydrolase n=1 Tax=Jannaschia formosa TaxID=2259592 RepID=UPI00142F7BBD|nr:alpha-amylase family glycosyl hydrolase [Jannaschia formosa]
MSLPPWPEASVIYQAYPRSFHDSTGSGTGDLNGVTQRLDYIASLNVDAAGLAPFFPSPFADGGYEVADHCDVHPPLGTLDDFDHLVERAHATGLRVMIDQVFNHTSDESPRFHRAIRQDSDYVECYVWRNP